ncbi:MAG: cytochrome-c peroxidase [bacterium]|nr:cytochrome-c peroxidase [bacterium]
MRHIARLIWALSLAPALLAQPIQLNIPLGLDAFMPIPDTNPLTRKIVILGEELFHDKRLSRDNSLSCATCHLPDNAFTDDKPVAVGVFDRTGNRRVPSLLNRGYGNAFFWDGRIPTLEEQVLQPIINPKEMDLPLEDAVARLRPKVSNPDELAHALAAYVRTILSGNSPYDRYVAGDRDALTDLQRAGLEIFRGKGDRTACHIGPNLTDELFHNTGVGFVNGSFPDPGRQIFTKDPADLGAFKPPTLRDVAGKAPYMHNGSLATLEEVIDHYSDGGIDNPNLDPDIAPLEFTDKEKQALLAFLEALSGTITHGLASLR